MALTATNGTAASMWAGRRDEPPSTGWGGNREPGSTFRGTTTRGRGRGGGRARAGGRGGRPPSDRSGLEGGGESQRLTNTTGKPTPFNNTVVRTRLSGSSDGPTVSEKTTSSTRVDSSVPGQRKGDTGDKNTRLNMNGLKDLPSQASSQRSAKLKPSGASLQSNTSTASSSSSKSSSRRRRGPGSRKSSISVKAPNALSSTPLAPSVPPTPMSAIRDTLQPFPVVESLSPMHDIRHDVDSLVDHVRTMAMEGNRSSSPATHIDWAVDDDDSLPDLEDWGISSKKVADVGDNAAKGDEPAKSAPATVSETDKVGEMSLSSSIESMADTSVTQGSTSSPTDSIPPSTSPTNSTVRARGERKRERGRGRDKEKKGPAITSVSPSTPKSTLHNTNAPRKSLLERLSSPTRPVPISVPSRPEKSPVRTFNGVGESRSPASTLPFHPSLPPKPASMPIPEGSPRRVNGSNFPPKPSSPWRSRHDDVAKVIAQTSTGTRQSAVAQSMLQSTEPAPEALEKTSSEKWATQVLEKAPEISDSKVTPVPESKVLTFVDAKDASFLASTSFDWSEEPTPFDPIFPSSSVKLDIEPPTPLEELPPSSTEANSGSPGLSMMRTRAQRPLSGDITPRQRRERSPHKTHNARNHSAPSPGGLNATRTRAPHATRPIIRMDALAMISRSLRESPTPSRRESPAPTVVSAAE